MKQPASMARMVRMAEARDEPRPFSILVEAQEIGIRGARPILIGLRECLEKEGQTN